MDPSTLPLRETCKFWDREQIHNNTAVFAVLPDELVVEVALKLFQMNDPHTIINSLGSLARTCRRFYLISTEPKIVSKAIKTIIQTVYFLYKPIGIGHCHKHMPLRNYAGDQTGSLNRFALMSTLSRAWNFAGKRIEHLATARESTKVLPLQGCKTVNLYSRLTNLSTLCPDLNKLDLRNTCTLDVGMQISGFIHFFEATLLLRLSETALGNRSFELTLNQMRVNFPKEGMKAACSSMLQCFSKSYMDRPALDEWLFREGGLRYCTQVSQPEITYPWDICVAENNWLPRVVSSPHATNLVGLRLSSLGDDSVDQLLSWPRLTSLNNLQLFLNKFEHIDDVSRLFMGRQLSALTTLKLNTIPFERQPDTDPSAALVGTICHSARNLDKLSLGAIPISDLSLQAILVSLTKLRCLEVRCYEPISDLSVAALENEQMRYRLEGLAFLEHSLTKAMITRWKDRKNPMKEPESLTFPRVSKLTLNGHPLDDAAVVDMLSVFPSLTGLYIGGLANAPRTISFALLGRTLGDIKKNGLSNGMEISPPTTVAVEPRSQESLFPLKVKRKRRGNDHDG